MKPKIDNEWVPEEFTSYPSKIFVNDEEYDVELVFTYISENTGYRSNRINAGAYSFQIDLGGLNFTQARLYTTGSATKVEYRFGIIIY